MRSIVSAIGSVTHAIARRIAAELQQFVGNTSYYIENSAHFIEKVKSLRLHDNDILVSFDVITLFTNIPIETTVELIKNRLPGRNRFTRRARFLQIIVEIISC